MPLSGAREGPDSTFDICARIAVQRVCGGVLFSYSQRRLRPRRYRAEDAARPCLAAGWRRR